ARPVPGPIALRARGRPCADRRPSGAPAPAGARRPRGTPHGSEPTVQRAVALLSLLVVSLAVASLAWPGRAGAPDPPPAGTRAPPAPSPPRPPAPTATPAACVPAPAAGWAPTVPPGGLVQLAGTPHLFVCGTDGLLHWAGDTRALAQQVALGQPVTWGVVVTL